MSLLTNIDKVNFTSRYDVDKVIHKVSGSRSVATAATMADSVLITIPHTLGYAPLVMGQFSESSNFSVAYEFGNPPYTYNATFAQYLPRIDATVESDSSNIYVFLINFDTTRTLYYRVVCLIPSGITSSPKMTLSDRNPLLFNSTDNFLKIYDDTKTTRAFAGFSPQTITIPHNLGYRPMALVYSEESGRVRRAGAENLVGNSGVYSTVYTDSANLYIEADTDFATNLTYHHRIYLDS